MLAAGSLKALSLMDENPAMFEDLHEKCQVMQESFDSCQGLELSGHVLSPVKHLHLAESRRRSRDEDKRLLRRIVAEVNYIAINSWGTFINANPVTFVFVWVPVTGIRW